MSIDKARIHHKLVVMRRVKYWQLLFLLVVFALASLFFLRQNSLEMVRLRSEVKQADEKGEGVEQALSNLQKYVTSHMNTDLGDGVSLQKSYEKAYQKAFDAAVEAQRSPQNKAASDRAHAECKAKHADNFNLYVNCARDILQKSTGSSSGRVEFREPPKEAFIYNFVAPVWSPDVAGISVILTGVVAIVLILKILLTIAFELMLKVKTRAFLG